MARHAQIEFGDIGHKTDEELNGAVIIGFDIDWAPDFILKDSLELAKTWGIKPTLFFTHESPLCNRIFKQNRFEFGLHPNFEKLLSGDWSNGQDALEVLNRLDQSFPGVKIIRSHSLTTSSKLKALFNKASYEIESSFVTQGTGKRFPNYWDEWTGLRQVPITWEDDIWFSSDRKPVEIDMLEIVKKDTLNVLTFHPIHLFLNTVNHRHYEESKSWMGHAANLMKCRNDGQVGVRSIFERVGALLNGEKDARC